MCVMNKKAAIALARQNDFPVEDGRCVFSNVNRGPRNVWWLDIPVEKAFQGVAILLCDCKSARLYCLDVPGSVFRDNAGDFFREDVDGVDKFRIEPSASKDDFMKDRRPGSAGFCFHPFVKKTVNINGNEKRSGVAVSNEGGVMGADTHHRFDASFPSVKVGIIISALSIVLHQSDILPVGLEFDQIITVLELVLHFALLFVASTWVWHLVWKELDSKTFRESLKSASFYIHVLATSLAPLLAGWLQTLSRPLDLTG